MRFNLQGISYNGAYRGERDVVTKQIPPPSKMAEELTYTFCSVFGQDLLQLYRFLQSDLSDYQHALEGIPIYEQWDKYTEKSHKSEILEWLLCTIKLNVLTQCAEYHKWHSTDFITLRDQILMEYKFLPGHNYKIVSSWSSEDQLYVARIAELPSLATHGNTAAEAKETMEDLLATIRHDEGEYTYFEEVFEHYFYGVMATHSRLRNVDPYEQG